ncbi:MAG: hypothetical protein KJ941_11630 [Bacteroidetes bacterium]|nr:hypothetical protein [Bacteroidota bacterium]
MKNRIIIFALLLLATASWAQKKESINLTNALIVGQFEKEDDRYNLEVALTEFFNENGVKAIPSLNVLKQGSDLRMLLLDTLEEVVSKKGIDTYLLCSVRGYDRRFKKASSTNDMETALGYGTLFSLYRAEVVSVTFEIFIYRNNQLVFSDLVRCGNVSTKEKVLIRLKKKLAKRIRKW